MHLRVGSSARFVAAILILAALASAGLPAEVANNARADESTILLSADSNPHAVLMEEFYRSGYKAQDASNLATRMIQRIRGEDVEPTDIAPSRETAVIPLHPDSNPHAVLFEAFHRSGWSVPEATNRANLSIQRVRGIEPREDGRPISNEECWVYSVMMVWCEDGVKQRKQQYINGLCYESLQICLMPKCPFGESIWFTVVTSACQWMSNRGIGGTWVDCDWMDMDCDDIESTDCSDIEPQCCHNTQSCTGCPDCD